MLRPAAWTEQAFNQFDATLKQAGVRAALAFLLSLTDYRFIAIFRFEGGKANAAVFCDAENPAQLGTDEVPDSATYCCYVRDSRGVFSTADAVLDARLDTHPAREQVRSYCGVPLLTAEGEILGTLCHYDVVPRDPEQIDLALMLQVASALALGGHVPPYPRRSDGSA